MSAVDHKRKWCHARVMFVLPLKADIRQREWHVRYVPIADSGDSRETGRYSCVTKNGTSLKNA